MMSVIYFKISQHFKMKKKTQNVMLPRNSTPRNFSKEIM